MATRRATVISSARTRTCILSSKCPSTHMSTCPHQRLTASADTSACETPNRGILHEPLELLQRAGIDSSASSASSAWLVCCGGTATLCSRYCAGSTCASASYELLLLVGVIWFIARGNMLSALALIVYCFIGLAQYIHACSPGLQLWQSVALVAMVTPATADSYGLSAFYVWAGLIGAMAHMCIAILELEIDRLGDCRRCMGTYSTCHCGRQKDSIPAGSVLRLALHLQRAWRVRSKRPLPPVHRSAE